MPPNVASHKSTLLASEQLINEQKTIMMKRRIRISLKQSPVPHSIGFIRILCITVLLYLSCSLHAAEIHDAAAVGNIEKVRVLLQTDPSLLELKDSDGNTPLHCACASNQMAVAVYLLDKGAGINVKNKNGSTPLKRAVSSRKLNISFIQYLINKGADVNAQSESGLSMLHNVAQTGNAELATLLINHGANIDLCDKIGYGTILQVAINLGPDAEVATLLVKRGAKINQKYSYGNTELHLAVLKGYTGLVKLLVNRGANVNAVNDYGHSALYYAAKHGHRQIAEALVLAGANKNDISETNNGKAPQLSRMLNDGEAYIWYLEGFYGGGYAVKTKGHLIIFDKTGVNESKDACLANGNLNPEELAGQRITVLITKVLGLKFEKQALELVKKMPDIHLVTDDIPMISDTMKASVPPYRQAIPHKSISTDSVTVYAISAMGRGNGGGKGVGYLVETDGIRIFHSGFHASPGNKVPQINWYRQEIDSLKAFAPIDIVFLPINAHLSVNYEAYLYLLDQLSPKAVYLMGGNIVTEEYQKCAEALRVRDIPVKYPEGGKAMGERFHYGGDTKQ